MTPSQNRAIVPTITHVEPPVPGFTTASRVATFVDVHGRPQRSVTPAVTPTVPTTEHRVASYQVRRDSIRRSVGIPPVPLVTELGVPAFLSRVFVHVHELRGHATLPRSF